MANTSTHPRYSGLRSQLVARGFWVGIKVLITNTMVIWRRICMVEVGSITNMIFWAWKSSQILLGNMWSLLLKFVCANLCLNWIGTASIGGSGRENTFAMDLPKNEISMPHLDLTELPCKAAWERRHQWIDVPLGLSLIHRRGRPNVPISRSTKLTCKLRSTYAY